MKIYIASSWKNQHGVEMLTQILRDHDHIVLSWIENNFGETPVAAGNYINFEEWMKTDSAERSFRFDISGAMECDLFIYYGPAGKDAAAECGMCYGRRMGKPIPMLALAAKGEDFGLMRKMFDGWFSRIPELLEETAKYRRILKLK